MAWTQEQALAYTHRVPLYAQAEWERLLTSCGVKNKYIQTWAPACADTVKIDSFSDPLDLPNFLGQIIHESAGFSHLVECLNYSAERLCQVWPHRFPTLAIAAQYAGNGEKLANFIYGGRMGNKNPGDGWLYRGRGPIQITGFDNYSFISDLMGQDFINMPMLMEQPRFAMEATIHWWEKRIPDSMLGDCEKVTLRVNGGLIGLADREELTAAVERELATA